MFDKFYNHLTIKAELVAMTGLHIGAGEESFDPTTPNGAVLRDGLKRPYIPGSSLKGVLRAFLAGVTDEPLVSSAIATLGDKQKRDQWKADNIKKVGNAAQAEMRLAEHIEFISTKTERLFGSQLMAGKVKLSDAILVGETQTDFRKGNAIDRDSHTAADKALFDTESVPAGTHFSFRLDAYNLTEEETTVLLELLNVFTVGDITVGGRIRAGLGRVMLANISYTMKNRVEGAFPKIINEKDDGVAINEEDVKKILTYQPSNKEAENVQKAC